MYAGAATLAVIAMDQASKAWMRHFLPVEGGVYPLIPGCLQLTHRRNPGIAFSMFDSHAWAPAVFAVIALAAALAIGWIVWHNRAMPRLLATAMGLVAGGALGNMIDRVHPPFMVVDFIDCYLGRYHWPAFNVADSAICIGVGALLLAHLVWPSSAQK